MDDHTPAEGWPDGPLSEETARALLGGTDHTAAPVRAVWVFDGDDEGARNALLGEDDPADAVVDLVLDTDGVYRPFSYTYGRRGLGWYDYGAEPKDGNEPMARRLASYRLLAGQSPLD